MCRILLGLACHKSHMRWRKSIGSIELQVSFAKEPYKREDILQKRPMILSSLLTVATPIRSRRRSVFIWIFRSISFPDRSFEWQGLHLLKWNFVQIFGESLKNLFEMYGDSRENLLEILAVVINLRPISSVRGNHGW